MTEKIGFIQISDSREIEVLTNLEDVIISGTVGSYTQTFRISTYETNELIAYLKTAKHKVMREQGRKPTCE